MKLHNKYGYGQLFCFSGLEGETSRNDDFVGMMMDGPITIRFHFETPVIFKAELQNAVFHAVTSDMLCGDGFFMAFANRNTVVGKLPVKPVIEGALGKFSLAVEHKSGAYYFAFTYGKEGKIPTDGELEQLKEARLAYFEALPACRHKEYEDLYYKCLMINRANVYSPEGEIPCRWTTPDRVPHRFMWLWDSAFHAMAFAQYNVPMAKDALRAVLSLQREDGFIAHMMSPQGRISEITQPPVLSWAVWQVYQKDRDRDFLIECAPALAEFLQWIMKNRDKNGNSLLEWFTEPDYTECKCGESGLDNSPRFDFDLDLDAIDFSTYLCNDAKYLSLIYKETGEAENADYFSTVHERIKAQINSLMWDEADGLYYDCLFSGERTRVASSSSFLPMFAGICSKAQADKMVKALTDEKRFWTELPVPSIPKDSELYDIDMWRGCSWLNINYFIILGLRQYGYHALADKLREKTLAAVYKWYQKTGNIFEFYDADDEISPFFLKRKGPQPEKPDYMVHVHAITDYNWSACFTLLLLGDCDKL